MATFTGSKQEFMDLFASNVLTNAVKSYTMPLRKVHKCAHCEKEIEVQAAHKKGTPGRREIAIEILDKYFTDPANSEMVKVDMLDFLTKFYDAHQPLEEHFVILCDECHKAYDKDDADKRRAPGSNIFSGYGKH